MQTWTIEDGIEVLYEIQDKAEIKKAILEIQSQITDKNLILLFISPDGNFMQTGISKNQNGFLNYHNRNDEPPYYSSINNKIQSMDCEEFYLAGNYAEIPLKNCIEINLVIAALEEFYQTNALPENIEWVED